MVQNQKCCYLSCSGWYNATVAATSAAAAGVCGGWDI